ncbi:helix-turn-helix domain-containing protein [Butyricicoccus faecihominis]|uniref:helix-turn-helix domain-containing protein n=1 Tax=Butyricicoccus faecihominis TaxID=1712515 RepID=UPI002479154D|nr:helix-turn-helix transcriptional regulator [Butyricicoccus faecihominis]MCQ5128969.1 helix-turn-helix domain-containing protein [Butyricicoccus faecihominis]
MRVKKEINIQIGNEIRIARERCGLTQAALGEMISLGTKNISDIERGVTGMTMSTLKHLCEQLPISSDTLLFGDRSKNNVAYLLERFEHLPQKDFAIVNDLLNHIFKSMALLNN